jgi:hypothetical protein
METIKNNSKQKQFSGLLQLIIIAAVVLFSPFVYFLINFMMGNENPVYIMMP